MLKLTLDLDNEELDILTDEIETSIQAHVSIQEQYALEETTIESIEDMVDSQYRLDTLSMILDKIRTARGA